MKSYNFKKVRHVPFVLEKDASSYFFAGSSKPKDFPFVSIDFGGKGYSEKQKAYKSYY
jgi:hypothetical protein